MLLFLSTVHEKGKHSLYSALRTVLKVLNGKCFIFLFTHAPFFPPLAVWVSCATGRWDVQEAGSSRGIPVQQLQLMHVLRTENSGTGTGRFLYFPWRMLSSETVAVTQLKTLPERKVRTAQSLFQEHQGMLWCNITTSFSPHFKPSTTNTCPRPGQRNVGEPLHCLWLDSQLVRRFGKLVVRNRNCGAAEFHQLFGALQPVWYHLLCFYLLHVVVFNLKKQGKWRINLSH